jgi:hypothetical protein
MRSMLSRCKNVIETRIHPPVGEVRTVRKSFGAPITFVHVFPGETIREFTTEDIRRRYERGRDIAKARLASFGDKMRRIYPRCSTRCQRRPRGCARLRQPR